MILRLALKSLLMHPVRAAVLGIGFGLGVDGRQAGVGPVAVRRVPVVIVVQAQIEGHGLARGVVDGVNARGGEAGE